MTTGQAMETLYYKIYNRLKSKGYTLFSRYGLYTKGHDGGILSLENCEYLRSIVHYCLITMPNEPREIICNYVDSDPDINDFILTLKPFFLNISQKRFRYDVHRTHKKINKRHLQLNHQFDEDYRREKLAAFSLGTSGEYIRFNNRHRDGEGRKTK